MRDDTPDTLDRVIEDAARSMTGGTPSPDLRTAVRRRIEAGGTPGRMFPGRFAWACGGAVVLLAAGVFVARDGRPVEPVVTTVTPVPRTEVVGGLPPAPPAPPVAPRIARDGMPPPHVAPDRNTRVAPGPAIDAPEAQAAVLPISDADAIESVQIEPLDPSPLDIELMEIPMPLRAERIEIEPIAIE